MTDPQYDDVLRELEETLGAYAAQAPRADGLAGAARARARHRAHRRAQVTTGVLGVAAVGVVGSIMIGAGALSGGSGDSQVGDYAGNAPQISAASDAQVAQKRATTAEAGVQALPEPTDVQATMHATAESTAAPEAQDGTRAMSETYAPQMQEPSQLQGTISSPKLAIGETRSLPARSCDIDYLATAGVSTEGGSASAPKPSAAYRLRVSADGSACEIVRLASVPTGCPAKGEALVLSDERGRLTSVPLPAGCTPR